MRIRRPIPSASRRRSHPSLQIIHRILCTRIKRLEILFMMMVVLLVILDQERSRDIVIGLLLVQIRQRAFEGAIHRVVGSVMACVMALVVVVLCGRGSALQGVGFVAGVDA